MLITQCRTQENGKAVSGPDLSVKLNGLSLPNPFVIGSGQHLCLNLFIASSCRVGPVCMLTDAFATGPPGTNYAVMKKAFDEGWGGVIAKTVSVDSSKVELPDVNS